MTTSDALRRPCVLRVDGGQRVTMAAPSLSSVDRLLADIAFQWQRERRRVADRPGQRQRRRPRDHGNRINVMTTSMTERRNGRDHCDGGGHDYDGSNYNDDDNDAADDADDYDEAASAYWWTDVFLRYFVFDENGDGAKSATVAADSDDLLFFVRRRRRRRRRRQRDDKRERCRRPSPTAHRRRRMIAYDTRAYRKQPHQRQQHQQPALLPIGDPAVLWRHTVCLNTIVHRLRYTLTVAVCVHVPRKSTTTAVADFYGRDNDAVDPELDGPDHQEYDLQLLSRHVHTVYASTSGRRMDADKGPRERPLYPAVCWAADDYAEAFRTIIVRPGQTVCAELVAAWPGSTVVEEYAEDYDDSGGEENDCEDDGRWDSGRRRVAVKVRQKQNRAVLFTAAVPYAAARATYECKMSLYREAERERRKRRKRNGGKKSSLSAALSASLTALFTGGKSTGRPGDGADYDCYYGTTAADRIEYVTVRGCTPGRDDDDDEWWSSGDETGLDDMSLSSDAYNNTKGLAQMAVALAPTRPTETLTPSCENGGGYLYRRQYYAAEDDGDVTNGGLGPEYGGGCYADDYDYDDTPVQRPQLESPSPYAASEPGDYYDYGWDYETAAGSGHQTPQTAAGSGHQTPQTPSSYGCYRQRRRRQLERQRRRRRPRRLSDPCSTSVYDLLYGDGQPDRCFYPQQYQQQQQQQYHHYNHQQQQHHHQQCQQQRTVAGQWGVGRRQRRPGGERTSATATPEEEYADRAERHPHRAWSESDGLDRCGGGGGGGGGVQQRQRQKAVPPVLMPPPPVPYYCAAEAAASGFAQFVHKSPADWWSRAKDRSRRIRKERQEGGGKSAATVRRRRSASAGGNGRWYDDDGCGGGGDGVGNGDGSGSDSAGDVGSDSDDQDSDGEFIGALAAAAAVGHDPDREWTGSAGGDPTADWEQWDSSSASGSDGDADLANSAHRRQAIEWTAEIVATDLRRTCPVRNEPIIATPPGSMTAQDNDAYWFGGGLGGRTSSVPVVVANQHQQQQQHGLNGSRQLQRRRRPAPPQFRPQPLEPPPPPPALSVAFTAVACPWWTVLEDVLLVTTTASLTDPGDPSNKSAHALPLLTFD